MAHPRQPGQPACPPQHQIGQRSPGQVARRHTIAHITAGPPQPRHRVVTHRRMPVSRDPQRSAPTVGHGIPLQDGEQPTQGALQLRENRWFRIELGPNLGPPVIGRPPAAEGDPVISRPLAIDDDVPVVGEGLALGQPDLVPHTGGQRLGSDHQGVDRGRAPSQPRQPRGPSLGRPHGMPGPHHRPRLQDHSTGRRGRDPGTLDNHSATRTHHCRKPVHKVARMDPRAVGVVGRAQQPRHPHPVSGLRQVKPDGAIAPGRAGSGIPAGSLDLRGSPRGEHDATTSVVAVDAFVGGDPADFEDGLTQGRAHGSRCGLTGFARQRAGRHRPQRRHPATVAPARPEPDVLGFQHDDGQRRVQPEQVVRRPQAREAAADDGDVDLGRGLRGIPRAHGAHPGCRGRGGYAALPPQRAGHRCASAPCRTERSREVMSSNSGWPMMSGGASWMTGSPRSSARQ